MTEPLYRLFIPESREPFRTTLDRPERLLVAWHRQALGARELLDSEGRSRYGRPQEDLWEIRAYCRIESLMTATEVYYERA